MDCLRGLDASSLQQTFLAAEGAEGAAGDSKGGGLFLPLQMREKRGRAPEINECVWRGGGVGLFLPLVDSTKRTVSRRNTTKALQKDFRPSGRDL